MSARILIAGTDLLEWVAGSAFLFDEPAAAGDRILIGDGTDLLEWDTGSAYLILDPAEVVAAPLGGPLLRPRRVRRYDDTDDEELVLILSLQ